MNPNTTEMFTWFKSTIQKVKESILFKVSVHTLYSINTHYVHTSAHLS